MKSNLVSVIIPVYNCEKYVTEAIKSAAKQSYENLEIIIVNDGSTDKSLKIIKKEIKEIKRKVILIDFEKNMGVSYARNKALEVASGDYVAYLDADDLWEKEKIEKQIKFMQEKKYYFSYTGYTRIRENGKFSRYVKAPIRTSYNDLLKNTIMLTSTIMINVKRVGKENLKMPNLPRSEDTETWLNILKNDLNAYGLDINLAKYRIRKNSISSNKVKSIKGIWTVYRKYEYIGRIKSAFYIIMHVINAVKKRIVIKGMQE